MLGGVGLAGALAYSIYELRHPDEQYHPDPEKKTLVILGKLRLFVYARAVELRRGSDSN